MAFAQLLEGLSAVAAAQANEALARSHAQHALEVALEALRRQRDNAVALALVRRLVPQVDRCWCRPFYLRTLETLPPA